MDNSSVLAEVCSARSCLVSRVVFQGSVFWKETVADVWYEIVFEGVLGSVPQLVLELWYYLMIVQGLDWIQVVGWRVVRCRSVVLWVWAVRGCIGTT